MTKSMSKEWIEKKEFDVKAIVEDAITSLVLHGMLHENALALLATQAIIRMHDTENLRRLIKLIEDRLIVDDEDA
jgi:hypothetical protein